MEHRCPNCGQLALDNDVACWHCGHQLPGREGGQLEQIEVSESWKHDVSAPNVLFYVGLTIAVALATVMMMASLGRRPLAQMALGDELIPEWELITDQDTSFAIQLPPDWDWTDNPDADGQTEIYTQLDPDRIYQATTFPFGSVVSDGELLLLGVGPQRRTDLSPPFLVVNRSLDLNSLNYEEVDQLLRRERSVVDGSLIGDIKKSRLSVVLDIPVGDGQSEHLRCKQIIAMSQVDGFIVATCVSTDRFAGLEMLFEQILDSFQLLSS